MSKGYQNRASVIACFIDYDFVIFAMFKTLILLIADYFSNWTLEMGCEIYSLKNASRI